MRAGRRRGWPNWLGWLLGLLLLVAPPLAEAQNQAQSPAAKALAARHLALRQALLDNQFQRPLYLESSQGGGRLQGDIYAELEQPYALVSPMLLGMAQWCDALILHLNVKACHPAPASAGALLKLYIGRKHDQPLADAYPFAFRFQVQAAEADYLRVLLSAAQGPLGTSDYRMQLEVLALAGGRSLIHLSYAYAYGMTASLAMQGYLASVGRDKVGFSIIGTTATGQPQYLGDMRGVMERNTMRYYLALDAYLGALALPAAAQQDKRLHDWHLGVERYPRQLHEMELAPYLAMKHREIRRQQQLAAAAARP